MRIERTKYLQELIDRKHNGLVKVITGIRRCGKSYLLITGEVAAVQMAIDTAKQDATGDGMYLDSSVIASPDPKLWDSIL